MRAKPRRSERPKQRPFPRLYHHQTEYAKITMNREENHAAS